MNLFIFCIVLGTQKGLWRFLKAFWIIFQILSLFPPKLFYGYSSLFGCRFPCSSPELPVFLCLIFKDTLLWPFVLLWLHSSSQMSCRVRPYHALSFFSLVPLRLICPSLTNTRHVLDHRFRRTIVQHARRPMTEASYIFGVKVLITPKRDDFWSIRIYFIL